MESMALLCSVRYWSCDAVGRPRRRRRRRRRRAAAGFTDYVGSIHQHQAMLLEGIKKYRLINFDCHLYASIT